MDDIIESAESALRDMEGEYETWVKEDVDKLVGFLAALDTGVPVPFDTLEKIHAIAHDIKGQAATFNYPLLTNVSKSLCHFIQKDEAAASKHRSLVSAHIDAMRLILNEGIKGSGGKDGRELAQALERAVEKILESA